MRNRPRSAEQLPSTRLSVAGRDPRGRGSPRRGARPRFRTVSPSQRRLPSLSQAARLRLAEVVFTYIEVVEDYRQRRYPTQRPEPGSAAEREISKLDRALAGDWSDEPAQLVYAMAELHMASAQDHLAGLAVLLRSEVDDSLMTVSRGVVEAASRAGWLLDPAIDGKTRVMRAMTERLVRLDEVTSRDERLGLPRDDETSTRADAIVRAADAYRIRVTPTRYGRYLADEPYPGQTAAVEALFAQLGPGFGGRAYADLSAVAHSALAAFAHRLSTIATAQTAADEGQPGLNDELGPVRRAVSIATAAYGIAVRRYFTLFSWQVGPWNAFVRDAQARMRQIMGVPRGAIDIRPSRE